MSDGPHRSLPLRGLWKSVADRASKDAWSIEDVAEATSKALERDLKEVPIQSIRKILGAGLELSLFAQNETAVLAELDRTRAECRGSAIGNAAIDGALHAVLEGDRGELACQRALQYALNQTLRSYSRSIEEHYQRKAGDRSARHMRDRLAAVGRSCDVDAIARRHGLSGGLAVRSPALARRTGIDDGPAMPR